ncbi:MAG: DUF4252 domain-containing protein [Bacteroidales bacterium]|nr:DUF4252 domain-containing protein [Bacteroidales bacterium]
MKKKILIILMAALLLPGVTEARKANPAAIRTVVRQFSTEEGFDTVSFGGFALSVVKAVAYKSTEEKEDRQALKAMSGIKRLMVVDYEEASDEARARFNKKIGKILEGVDKFMEVKDDGECVSIYGSLSKDGSKISDLILYIPDSSTLICLFGSVRTDAIEDIVHESQSI